jgi:hypothetical protein
VRSEPVSPAGAGAGRQGAGRQGAGRQVAGRQGAGRQGAGRQGAVAGQQGVTWQIDPAQRPRQTRLRGAAPRPVLSLKLQVLVAHSSQLLHVHCQVRYHD